MTDMEVTQCFQYITTALILCCKQHDAFCCDIECLVGGSVILFLLQRTTVQSTDTCMGQSVTEIVCLQLFCLICIFHKINHVFCKATQYITDLLSAKQEGILNFNQFRYFLKQWREGCFILNACKIKIVDGIQKDIQFLTGWCMSCLFHFCRQTVFHSIPYIIKAKHTNITPTFMFLFFSTSYVQMASS